MASDLKSLLFKTEPYFLYSVAFFFPLHKGWIPYVIAVYCAVFVFSGRWKHLLEGFRHRYVYLTTIFYAILLLGISYSSETGAAWFDLEVKFSLLLFPILMGARKLNKKELYRIFLAFVLGCLLATIICLVAALFYYLDSHNVSVFYYQDLSVFQHPAYFSMYLNFCIYLIYYFMVFDKEVNIFRSEVLMVSIIVLFSLFVVLLSSKIGLITLFMVIFTGTIFWFLKSRAIFPSLMVFAMLSTLIYASFKYSNYIQGRIQEAVNSISDEKVTFTTTGARIAIWNQALELISESPLIGYGTGDVKHELISKYEEKGYDHLVELKLNAHNQYLQMLIAIGLIGSIFFWMYMFYPVMEKGFFRNTLYVGLFSLISLNFLTESMLETQAGVVFYAFFNSILYMNRELVVPMSFKREK